MKEIKRPKFEDIAPPLPKEVASISLAGKPKSKTYIYLNLERNYTMNYTLKIDTDRYDKLFEYELYDLGLYPLTIDEAEALKHSGRLYRLDFEEAVPVDPNEDLDEKIDYAFDLSFELLQAYKQYPNESNMDIRAKGSLSNYMDMRLSDPDHLETLKCYTPAEAVIYNV